MTDFTLENHGSVCLLRPHTEAAQAFIDGELPEDVLTFGGAVAVEPRYVDPLVEGIVADHGLTLEVR